MEAYKRKDSDFVKLYRRALNKLEEADRVAREGQLLQKLSSELVWDQLQLTGQADVFLSEARESRYEEFLMPVFKDEVKSRSKNPETRKEKYESNSLFDSKAKLDRTVKDLAKTDNKVRIYFWKFFSINLHSFSACQGGEIQDFWGCFVLGFWKQRKGGKVQVQNQTHRQEYKEQEQEASLCRRWFSGQAR